MSDATTKETPRLKLEPNDEAALGMVVRELYEDVMSTLRQHADLTPEQVMQRVVDRWIMAKRGTFLILLCWWSATSHQAPDIWEEPVTNCRFDESPLTAVFEMTWQLKPFDEIDLMVDDLGGGDGFFSCFERRDIISEVEWELLLTVLDERDRQLASTSDT